LHQTTSACSTLKLSQLQLTRSRRHTVGRFIQSSTTWWSWLPTSREIVSSVSGRPGADTAVNRSLWLSGSEADVAECPVLAGTTGSRLAPTADLGQRARESTGSFLARSRTHVTGQPVARQRPVWCCPVVSPAARIDCALDANSHIELTCFGVKAPVTRSLPGPLVA